MKFLATRWLALFVACLTLLCVVFILQFTRFPYELPRLYIFDYLLRYEDLPGAAVVLAIALAAALPGISRPALALVDAVGRRPREAALGTFIVLCAAQVLIAKKYPLAGDEHLILMQAKAFAAGHLTAQFPPDLLTWVVPWPYEGLWLYANVHDGRVVSVYWPGFALVLAPFSLLGIPWVCNPLLASGSLFLIGRLAARLTGAPQAAGWAMLLTLASPTFTGMALGYFSMMAHLFCNLLFVFMLLERRLVLAGVIGSFALVLNNPVPHALFALPWIVWIAWRDGRWALLRLAAGYAPVGLVVGLGWWLLMRDVQGHLRFEPYARDGGTGSGLGNFLFYFQLQINRVFREPSLAILAKRSAELAKLWLWTVPGLLALASLGWWLARRELYLRLLGLSFLCTWLGYFAVWFDQGYGWGARYLHPALAALPVLGAAAIITLQSESLRRYVAAAALLSLVVATPFRWSQVEAFMADHLSRRPPIDPGAREIVFVRLSFPYYTQDFVQNDPFLRDPVIFMLSRGRAADEQLLRSRFPKAHLAREAPYGHVWRLD
jgi:hypothetical protein